MNTRFVAIAMFAIAAPAAAQQHAEHSMDHGLVVAVRSIYDGVKSNILRAAELMPEEHYAFRPTPDVRSFGQLLGHIANANYNYCAIALAETSPNTVNIEQTATTRAALVEAVRASFDYCDGAYAIPDMKAMEMTTIMRAERPRLWALVQNASHDNEHYGNIVTYMRIKGITPPSSMR
ncbi:MAG: DinB family protein [Gemmatimonadetes bacterium]|nr:DinB family protein [Gemmatimonadota bacterium]